MGETSSTTDTPVPSLLENFVLLNENGEPSAARDPKTGLSPFGVLYSLENGQGGMCSASHLTMTLVMTAAHCLASDDAGDYRVLFYDRHNRRRVERIQSIAYPGDPDGLDIALMSLKDAEIADWDDLNWEHQASPLAISGPLHAYLWAFDPIFEHPQWAEHYGKKGAVFSRKDCTVSPVQPRYSGGLLVTRHTVRLGKVDPPEQAHIYYDDCKTQTMAGNSGALITGDSIRDLVGVHHGTYGPSPDQLQDYDFFLFNAITGPQRQIWADQVPERGLYSTGVGLDQAVKIDFELARFF